MPTIPPTPESSDAAIEADFRAAPTLPDEELHWWAFVGDMLWKLIRNGLGLVSFVVFLFGFLLQFSFFQTIAVRQIFYYAGRELGFQLEISNFYFNFFTSHATFSGLSISDHNDKQMVFAEQLMVDIDYTRLLKNGDVHVVEIILKRGSVNLIYDKKGTLNFQHFIDKIDALTASPTPRKRNKPPSLVAIDKIEIADTYISYHDNRREHQVGEGIDYAHFGLDELSLRGEKMRLIGDTIEIGLKGVRALEHDSQLKLRDLTTLFRLTRKSIEFHQLHLAFGNSVIRNELFLSFAKQSDMSSFVEKVNINAYLDSTIIDTDDLAIFAPAVRQYRDVWRLSGQFRGRVNDFTFKNADLQLGKQSRVVGELAFEGLPDTDKLYMDLRLKPSQIFAPELKPYINNTAAAPYLDKLGLIQVRADLTGFLHDFVARGSFQTPLGNFDSDLRLALKPDMAQSYYKGDIRTARFLIGELLGVRAEGLNEIGIVGSVEGTGFTPQTAKLTLDAQINQLGFNGYQYKDIAIDGKLQRGKFEGELIANDPNLNFDIQGIIDTNPNSENPQLPAGRFNLQSHIRRINLQALGFSAIPLEFKGNLTLDLHGLNLDELAGEAILDSAFVLYDKRGLAINNAELLSFSDNSGTRLFDFRSEYIDLSAKGNFKFSRLMSDLQALAEEYALSFRNVPKEIEKYYSQKPKYHDKDRYALDFEVNLQQANEVIQLFNQSLRIAPDAHLYGTFRYGKSTRLDIFTRDSIPFIAYGSNKLEKIGIDFHSSKMIDAPQVLAEASVRSAKQDVGGLHTENMLLNAVWGDNLLDFTLFAKQQASTNFVDLAGTTRFLEDTTQVVLKPSTLQLLNRKWLFERDNAINFTSSGIFFQNVKLYKDRTPTTQIAVNGVLSATMPDPVRLKVQNIDLLSFADLIGLKLRGVLNLDLDLTELYTRPQVRGQMRTRELILGKTYIGDLEGGVAWQDSIQTLGVNLSLYRFSSDVPALSLTGDYRPADNKNALQLTADFARPGISLQVIEPFAEGIISEVLGYAQGRLNIRGTLAQPIVTGTARINNGRFKFNYLGTTYDLEGDFKFSENEIYAPNAVLYDAYTNPAIASVQVFHDGFKNIILDVKANFYDFQLLHTTEKDNALYYGEAYAKGDLRITGSLSNLNVSVNAKSRRGTKIFMPLDGYAEVGQKEFIRYVKPNEMQGNKVRKINLGGLSLNMNMEVTPDADFEIIIDSKAGDRIVGKGNGNIRMNIDPQGDLKMFGYYVIQEGKYNFNFSFMNVKALSKSFEIQPGGRITFAGDPLNSNLDIRALYSRNVSLKPLIDLQSVPDPNNREYSRFYSVKATMDMRGALFTPEIKLGLDLSEPKKMTTNNMFLQNGIYQLENAMATSEQERNKQVFSLLVLGRLTEINAFSGVGGGATSSISEVFASQVGGWLASLDPNLELNINLDPANVNTFQMRLSYNMLDGRLRITRDGGWFTNTNNQSSFNTLFGDWTLEYLLSASGKYRLKTYYRTNQSIINNANLNNANATMAGFSILQTSGFNRLADLFKSTKKMEGEERARLEAQREKQEELAIFTRPESQVQTPNTPDQATSPNLNKPVAVEELAEILPLNPRFDVYKPSKSKPQNTIQPNIPQNIPLDDDEEIPDQYLSEEERQARQKARENAPKIKPEGLYPKGHRYDIPKTGIK